MPTKKISKTVTNKRATSRVSATLAKRKTSKVLSKTSVPKKAQSADKSKQKKSEQLTNQWRNEPGVGEPLRVGRGMRTRDNNFKGQKNKIIHPEQPQNELYRRVAVVDIDDDKNVAVVQIKRKNARNGVPVPQDKQGRKYIPDILTLDDNSRPLRIKEGKLELAPSSEDLSAKQAQAILSEVENKSRVQKQRLALFRKNKKNRD